MTATLDIAALYAEHAPAITSYFRHRLPGRDLETAEDLTGDVFLRALKAAPRYQDTGKPIQAWLYRIARNLLIDHRRRTVTTVELLPDLDVWAVVDAGAEHHADVLDVARLVRALKPAYCDIITERYLREHDVAQTMQALGITKHAVMGRTFGAIRAMRQQMERVS